jgi:hypothetical protein
MGPVEGFEVSGRRAQALAENIRLVIRGKDDQVKMAVIALISGGHLLIEDVPGVGKTMLARSLALSISGSYFRIQFTPEPPFSTRALPSSSSAPAPSSPTWCWRTR